MVARRCAFHTFKLLCLIIYIYTPHLRILALLNTLRADEVALSRADEVALSRADEVALSRADEVALSRADEVALSSLMTSLMLYCATQMQYQHRRKRLHHVILYSVIGT